MGYGLSQKKLILLIKVKFLICQVLQTEMMAIRRACIAVSDNVFKYAKGDIALGETEGKYEPQITFMAVQKRHKTRFFCNNMSDGVGKVNSKLLILFCNVCSKYYKIVNNIRMNNLSKSLICV